MRKYLIWDFDGTLGYRVGMWTGAMLEILRKNFPDRNVSPHQIRPFLQKGFPWHNPDHPHPEISTGDEWWNRLNPIFERAFMEGVGLGFQQAKMLANQVRRIYPDPTYWRLYDDTLPTLNLLSNRGWRHLLLSNHVPELGDILSALGIDQYFEKIYNSAETGYEKPHSEAFQRVLAAANDYSIIWMIGDNMQADIRGAEKVGLSSILVRKEHPEAKIYCEKLSQIAGLL